MKNPLKKMRDEQWKKVPSLKDQEAERRFEL
jgi:hypothetical protein